jgi:hypothetical protein
MPLVSVQLQRESHPAFIGSSSGDESSYRQKKSKTEELEGPLSLATRVVGLQQIQTRRWGRGNRLSQQSSPKSNAFSQVAPAWFYSLLGNFLERKENTRIWRGTSGATFLARFFQTLATFVECSRNTPGSDVMAKDLVQLVWGFRSAEVSEVRASVLFTIATCFNQLRSEVVIGMILDDSADSLGSNLPTIAASDPDESCRNIASLLVRNVADALQTINSSPEPLATLLL